MAGMPRLGRAGARRAFRAYGAGPLHLLVLLASFVLTAYAAVRLAGARPLAVGAWFLGSAVAHDLVLFPVYALADAAIVRALRARPRAAALRGVPWLNHLRFPAVISAILLLVYSPLIFRVPANFAGITGRTTAGYPLRWALLTAGLFALSALVYALRVAMARPPGAPAAPDQEGPAGSRS